MINCIYVAASQMDSRYTRICVASIRHFYPDVCIRLLAGGPLPRGLREELRRYWNVESAPFLEGEYGWGFVKLEPLFGSRGERFLVVDSDTVFSGRVLDVWAHESAPFLVDDEQQSAADTKRLYYDWERVRAVDPRAQPPRFVFNSGQWFGTSGVLTREDFAPWIDWRMPRTLRHPDCFMPSDQGVLNYVLNQKAALDGLRVERGEIMRWPGHSMRGLSAESVARGTADSRIVHWAGMKKLWQRDMVGSDLLAYFEDAYYRRVPSGRARRAWTLSQHVSAACLERARLTVRRLAR